MADKLIEMAKEVGTTEYYCAYAKEEHCPCEDKGEIKCESTELYRAIFTKDQLKSFANLIRADEQSKLGEPVAWMHKEIKSCLFESPMSSIDKFIPLYAKKG